MKAHTLVALLALAALIGGGVYYWQSDKKETEPQAETAGNIQLVAGPGCYG